jgi:hypothetical protein
VLLFWGSSFVNAILEDSLKKCLFGASRIPLLEWLGTWLRFRVSEVLCGSASH